LTKDDAEEFTRSLSQIVGGSWRQIALAKRLGVPQALDLSTNEWVQKRLGGYIRQTIEERRAAVAELSSEGQSTREIAETLGVGKSTIADDIAAQNRTEEPVNTAGFVQNRPPAPLGAEAVGDNSRKRIFTVALDDLELAVQMMNSLMSLEEMQRLAELLARKIEWRHEMDKRRSKGASK
jgi:transposase-like protein